MTQKGTELYQQHKICMAAHTVLLLINTACTFLSARYLASFVEIFTAFSYERGLVIIAKLAVVFVIQLLCAYVKNRYWMLYRERKTNELECGIYRKYLQATNRSDSESRLSILCEKDIPQCIGFFTEKIPLAIQAVTGTVVYAVYLAGRPDGAGVLLLLLVISVFQFLPPLIAEKYLVKNYIAAGQEEEHVRQEIISGLAGIFTIKMYHLHDWFMERYRKRQREFQKAGERAAGTSSIQSALYSGVLLIQQMGFLLIGIFMAAYGSVSFETLIVGYGLSASFCQYVAKLGTLKADRSVCRAAEKRIADLFQAREENPLFQNLEMELPGAGIWLVKGENGAGKSTLLSIIGGGTYSNARIVWKGKALEGDMRLKKTGWCPQMYLPISASFRELVELIPEKLVDREYLQICIRRFGLDWELLEKPLQKLSGGQQKKLLLSLALAKKCDILLLDEPEVSLDRAGSARLKALLEKEDRLVLLVTHSFLFDDIAEGEIRVKGGEVCA